MTARLACGTLASAAIAAAGWRAGALSRGGAVAATCVGVATIAGAGWRGATLLGAFFGPSSALSCLALPSDIAAKGGRRDVAQVLANGAVAALAARGGSRVLDLPAAFAGALAAASADTWATEIGSRSAAQPRTLLGGTVVERGASGGVTPLGTAAAAGGAALIGLMSAALWRRDDQPGPARVAVGLTLAGLSGSVADSLLGASVQAKRRCPVCDRPAEARVHSCGAVTALDGGVSWVGNDLVNAGCTLVGAAVAAALTRAMHPRAVDERTR